MLRQRAWLNEFIASSAHARPSPGRRCCSTQPAECGTVRPDPFIRIPRGKSDLERARAVDVGDLEMDVADPDALADRRVGDGLAHASSNLSRPRISSNSPPS